MKFISRKLLEAIAGIAKFTSWDDDFSVLILRERKIIVIIDVHAHYLPKAVGQPKYRDFFEVRDGDQGKQVFIGGNLIVRLEPGLIDLAVQIADMDATGIDRRFLSVPPFAFLYEHKDATRWAMLINDSYREDIALFADRFRLLATLPLKSTDDACTELERIMAMPEYVGVEIATNIAGKELSDPSLDAFWAAAEKFGAFVLVHPYYYIETPRFSRFHIANLIGNHLETMLTATYLMADGVIEKYPKLKICLSHGGGYLPLGVARLDHGFAVRPEFAHMKQVPSELARGFYVDTILYDDECIDFVIKRMGSSQVMLGTDYPFDMRDPDPVGAIKRAVTDGNIREAVFCENIKKILKY